MIHNESSRLPLWLPVLLGCGIALYFAADAPTPFWPYGLGVLVMGGCIMVCRKAAYKLVALMMAVLLLGAAASAVRLSIVEAPVLREPVFFKMVEGTVEDIQHKEKKTKLILGDATVETLAARDTPKWLSVSMRKKENDTIIHIGDHIRVPAMLFPPPSPVMPGAYDFARMFYFEQLGAVGFSPREPLVTAPPSGNHQPITALRLAISDHLVTVMGNDMGAVASALMVGEQSRVPEDISDSMRASGIYHILSISGLHMSLATGLIFFVIRLLLAMIPHAALHWPNKKIAAICGLLGGFAYLLLAGAPVPAVRSYIMVACVLGAILMDRKGISMFSLAWAATLILLLMPESLFTASFQLTFAATLSIVALYERFGHVFFHAHASVIQKIFLYFLGLMITSLAVTFYTAPLAIIHFNRMAIFGIVANMLIVPLSSFWIMPMAMLSFIAMPLGWDALPLAGLKLGLEWMMRGSYFFSSLPYANITLPAPSAAGVACIVVGGLWLALWVSRIRWLGIVMMLAGLFTIALFTPYDLIISDDAKRVAYRSESGEWVMIRGDVDSFEAEIWLRMQGAEAMLSRKEAVARVKELRCDKTSCMIERTGKTIVISLRKSEDNFCESGADVVIIDRYFSCDNIPYRIDRAFVEQHGASALRFTDGVIELTTTQKTRGHWPWVQGIENDRDDQAETP